MEKEEHKVQQKQKKKTSQGMNCSSMTTAATATTKTTIGFDLPNGQRMPAFALDLRCSKFFNEEAEVQSREALRSAMALDQHHYCHLLISSADFPMFNKCQKQLIVEGLNEFGASEAGKQRRLPSFVSIAVDCGDVGSKYTAETDDSEEWILKLMAAAASESGDIDAGFTKMDLLLLGVDNKAKVSKAAVGKRSTTKKNVAVALDMEQQSKPSPTTILTNGLKNEEKPAAKLMPFDKLLNCLKSVEKLISSAGIGPPTPAIGLFGALRPEQVEQLWHSVSSMKPCCWLLDMHTLLDSFKPIMELASRLNLRLMVRTGSVGQQMKKKIANNDGVSDGGQTTSATFCNKLLREVARKYGKTATQLLHRWLFQNGIVIVCPGNAQVNPKRLAEQADIFNFQISREDMKRLKALHSRRVEDLSSPYKLAQQNGSHTGRQLMNQRRWAGDMAFGLALAGIALMVAANEFAFAGFPKRLVEATRIGTFACTVALMAACLRYHWLELRLYMHHNNVHTWQIALNKREKLKLVAELLVCSICPLPGGLSWPTADAFLGALMFLRLYWVPRCLHLHSRLSTDAAAKSIAGLNRVRTDTRFMLKRMLFLYPGLAMSSFVLTFWIIGAYILRLCESQDERVQSYYNAIWMMCVTFLTIGYGDIYPVTTCGRLMAVMTGVVGVCVASMIVAVIVQKISLSQAEERVHNFMARTKHARNLKETAAQVLKESWFLYKNRQIFDQERVRLHQRRLSAAICTLRKLRKEQRVLQELDGTCLDDVAKVSQSAVELVRGLGQAQQSLSERINGMECRLEQIHAGLGELMNALLPATPAAPLKLEKNPMTATTTVATGNLVPTITIKRSSDEAEEEEN